MKILKYTLLILLIYIPQSLASVCPSFLVFRSDNPVKKTTDLSSIVFIGEAVSVTRKTFRAKGYEEQVLEISAKFDVSETLKGSSKSSIVIEGNADGDCGCNYLFEPGVKYLVYANKHKNKYQTIICQLIMPTSNTLFSETLENIRSGQNQ